MQSKIEDLQPYLRRLQCLHNLPEHVRDSINGKAPEVKVIAVSATAGKQQPAK